MTDTMPALFVAHGAPTLATNTIAGAEYNRWARSLPQPDAILVFSAHWETSQPVFGEIDQHNNLIYDFGGFPDQLYTLQYPAPGDSNLVHMINNLLDTEYKIEQTNRGLDHGVWVPFLHMWPKADIPILQMSIPVTFSDSQLFELGKKLSPLRKNKILIIGTGSITHNLRRLNYNDNSEPESWAVEFDAWVQQVLNDHDYHSLLNWKTTAPHVTLNHPTPEHFKPILIPAGAAQNEPVMFPMKGFEFGNLSRLCVQFA